MIKPFKPRAMHLALLPHNVVAAAQQKHILEGPNRKRGIYQAAHAKFAHRRTIFRALR